MNIVLRFVRLSAAVFVIVLSFAQPLTVAHATVGATLTVNSNLDVDAADGVCTLREAMSAAANNADYHGCVNSSGSGYGDDLIQFSISSSTTITLGSALPILFPGTGALTIQGINGGRPVVIDGAGAYRVFNISSGATLTLANLTVQHASAGAGSSGGGAYNGGILVVLRSTFRNNTAGNDGGAIDNGGSLTIANSTFYGNSANYGGALLNNSATASIYNSTFSGNIAAVNGGALGTYEGGATAPVTHIYNTILANSSAPEDCFRWEGLSGTMTGDHNIIERSTTNGATPDCSAVAASSSDPNLGAAAGSPAYLPLNAGSRAIDAGNSTSCTGAPVNNASQNSIPRPQDGNNDGTPICDIGSYEKPVTWSIRSSGAQDGWVLESTETSSAGGSTRDATGITLRVGDDAGDRQYRAILSFATVSLPDTAVIQSVTLKVKRSSQTGALNPVTSLLGFQPDVQRGFFGTAAGLESADFQFRTSATKTVGPFTPAAVSSWYTLDLSGAKAYINKMSTGGGVTQVRLKFKLDDNDNLAANFLALSSGNAATTADRPLLTIVYYVP